MKSINGSLLVLSLFAYFLTSCEKNPGNNDPLAISGKLIHVSACKSNASLATPHSSLVPRPLSLASPNLSCVQYTYDKLKGKLTLKHINAGFNCCPDTITCEVKQSGSTLEIREKEASSLCNCDCLYDLDMVIDGLFEMKYTIKFIEPYASELEPLIFVIDLKENPTGSYCVVRDGYPWGM